MLKISVFFLLFLALMVDNAHAYVDFGAGSYVLQILLASAISVIFLIKNYVNKVKGFFMRKKSSDEDIANKSKKQ